MYFEAGELHLRYLKHFDAERPARPQLRAYGFRGIREMNHRVQHDDQSSYLVHEREGGFHNVRFWKHRRRLVSRDLCKRGARFLVHSNRNSGFRRPRWIGSQNPRAGTTRCWTL